jgi:hypothetical protein
MDKCIPLQLRRSKQTALKLCVNAHIQQDYINDSERIHGVFFKLGNKWDFNKILCTDRRQGQAQIHMEALGEVTRSLNV